jgi:small subunit ribosomal protein S6
MFIVKTTIDEKAVNETVDMLKSVITDMKGTITDFKELGQKEFAYEVKKQISGFYYVFNCEADSETVAEFDRKARINENLLRHLIIKLDEE